MFDVKNLTIIIPHLGAHRDQCYSLTQCRASLQETYPNVRVLVAKNGNKFCECVWDMHVKEQGQCKAVNAVVQTTNTYWIMVSNDDMIYPPFWLDNLTGSDPLIDPCVSPMLIEPRVGAPTFEVYPCGGAGGDFNKAKFVDYAYKHVKQSSPMRNGFNLPFMMRRDLWDTVGGYDINYDPWGSNSDSDLLYKVRLTGVQPKQNQNCLVYHFSQTSGTFEQKNDSYRMDNYAYFKEKWGVERTDDHIWEADFHMPTQAEGRIYFPEFEGVYAK